MTPDQIRLRVAERVNGALDVADDEGLLSPPDDLSDADRAAWVSEMAHVRALLRRRGRRLALATARPPS